MKPEYLPALIENSPLLHGWLHKATRGLCPEAVKRVSREIREHYLAVVEEHLAAGASPADAEAAALHALGSPSTARRQLKKSNLTTGEAQILKHIQGSLWQLPGVLLIIPAIALGTHAGGRQVQSVPFYVILLFVLAQNLEIALGPPLRYIFRRASPGAIATSIACLHILLLCGYCGPLLVEMNKDYGTFLAGAATGADWAGLAAMTGLPAAHSWFKIRPLINLARKLPAAHGPLQQ